MRKIVLALLLAVASLHAIEIDEYKVDLYYANGIMMQEDEKQARKDWQRRVKQLLQNYPNFQKRVGKADVSYNLSDGMVADMWEAFLQKTQLDNTYKLSWFAFKRLLSKVSYTRALRWMIKASEIAGKINEGITLDKQVEQYKESIDSGHGVVVLAHSQGNLFTAKAFKRMGWRKPYFHTIAIASPHNVIPNDGHAITFDNDMIRDVPMASQKTINNPNRHDQVYYPRNALNEINGPRTLERDIKSVQYHGFEYYLGYPTYEEVLMSGSTGEDAITRKVKMQTIDAMSEIQYWLLEEMRNHSDSNKRPSQWITSEESDKNTCDYRITVKHRFDPSIEMGETVYPFNGSKKLYQVKGEYVKASSGGKNILSAWEGKKENECYKIDNPQEEKIVDKRVVYKEHINYSILAAIHWDGTLREVIDLYAYNKSIFVYHYAHSSIGVQADLNENGTTPTREEYASWIEKGYSAMMQKIPLLETKINTFMLKKQTDLVKKYGRDNVHFSAAENTYENCKQHSNYPSEQTCRKSFNVAVSVKAVEDPFRKK